LSQGSLSGGSIYGAGLLPVWFSKRLYRVALLRGYLDVWLDDYLVRPSLAVLSACDRWERRWTDFLAGSQSRESDRLPPAAGSLEDLA
jgi:NAD(P)H-quinone oxidoreductase subunit 5